MGKSVAILIPCFNEEKTIATVVKDCYKAMPTAKVYVYDNNSTDKTVAFARKAEAIIRFECLQGKGNVVRRMFSDIEADIYVMIDGDGTYDIKAIPDLINMLEQENLDMVIGKRIDTSQQCYRLGHRVGNLFLTKVVSTFFRYPIKDMLSGLRVFSKRFVKTFPAESRGFEIETELTIYALSRRLPIKEVATNYYPRPEESFSKLSTYKDGIRILKTIIFLIKDECPLKFFSIISFVLFITGILLGYPVVKEFINTGLVLHFPTAILASGIMICAFISFLIGLVLDGVSETKKELARCNYLKYKE